MEKSLISLKNEIKIIKLRIIIFSAYKQAHILSIDIDLGPSGKIAFYLIFLFLLKYARNIRIPNYNIVKHYTLLIYIVSYFNFYRLANSKKLKFLKAQYRKAILLLDHVALTLYYHSNNLQSQIKVLIIVIRYI